MTDLTLDAADDTPPSGAAALADRPYDSRYSTVLIVVLIEALAVAMLVVVLVAMLMSFEPRVQLAFMQGNGTVKPLVSLRNPNLSDSAIVRWSANTVSQTMTFNFNTWSKTLNEARSNFTDEGYRGLREAFDRTHFIDDVIARRQLVTAVPSGPPVISQQGAVAGAYGWVVQVPIVITFSSGVRSGDVSQMRVVTLRLQQVPTSDNVMGLAIAQWKSETRTAS